MAKITIIVWLILAPTLMGFSLLGVFLIPELARNEMQWILPAVLLAAVIAIPASYLVAKKMSAFGEQNS